ncbi:hypothetical protein J2Z21_004019 [Streptomyces griseochromogenes]|uniref:Secreted protein n=1 Tax=Streptomyces griseochromogenes TaxID=68214 RepID=A0A1B1BEM1_9ACTN|nr:hypothetical protein [Streptomyces griseochromogenes]ANP57209.1 hypothetical protein AVL59_46500 [Streptomyces griseochromogenes]MBP2051069.1 hypothetical protein [Streptomyces griseochromogenes]
MSTARRRPPRPHAWLRLLVLLLALLVPGTHAQAQAEPTPTALAETVESVEHDALDTLVRPPAGAVHRADAPERPAPLSDPAPARPAARSCPAVPRPPYTLPLLRTVVLRC